MAGKKKKFGRRKKIASEGGGVGSVSKRPSTGLGRSIVEEGMKFAKDFINARTGKNFVKDETEKKKKKKKFGRRKK